MATKEQIEARRSRFFLEAFVTRICDRMYNEVDQARAEMLRVLAIAEEEHRQFSRPSRYRAKPRPERTRRGKKPT